VGSEKCDLNLPFCSQDVKEDFQHKIISFIPLKVKNYPPEIIEDFYGKNYHLSFIHEFKKHSRDKNENLDFDDILIERHIHRCEMQFKDKYIINKFAESEKERESNISAMDIPINKSYSIRKSKESNNFYDSLENSTDDGMVSSTRKVYSKHRGSHKISKIN
jgi:hypothetical protein